MKIHLIRKETVEKFISNNAPGRNSFNEWLGMIKSGDWNTPADIITTFPSADLLGNGTNRVIFDIGGNRYRMISKYAFGDKLVHLFICWIGTHAQYDKICTNNQQYIINNY